MHQVITRSVRSMEPNEEMDKKSIQANVDVMRFVEDTYISLERYPLPLPIYKYPKTLTPSVSPTIPIQCPRRLR